MNRLVMVVLKNIAIVPAAWVKLCKYAKHTDESAVLFDEHGTGTQLFAVDGHAVIVQAIVLRLIALVHEGAQSYVGEGRADLASADMIVGNRDDRTVFVRQIVERDLVVRAQCVTEKFCQFYIVLEQRIGNCRHENTPFFRKTTAHSWIFDNIIIYRHRSVKKIFSEIESFYYVRKMEVYVYLTQITVLKMKIPTKCTTNWQ